MVPSAEVLGTAPKLDRDFARDGLSPQRVFQRSDQLVQGYGFVVSDIVDAGVGGGYGGLNLIIAAGRTK